MTLNKKSASPKPAAASVSAATSGSTPAQRAARRSLGFYLVLSALIRFILVCVGFHHLLWLAEDRNRHAEHLALSGRELDAWTDAGYSALMTANLLLICGAALAWPCFVAAWITAYSFVIVYSSGKYLNDGTVPWTPGISYSASESFLRRHSGASYGSLTSFETERMRPVVATLLSLVYYMTVFLAFTALSFIDLARETEARVGRAAAARSRVFAVSNLDEEEAGAGAGAGRRSRVELLEVRISGDNRNSSSGNDLESQETPPPSYLEAAKKKLKREAPPPPYVVNV